MSDDRHERGMAVRREVLGDAHVDASLEAATEVTAEFQDLIVVRRPFPALQRGRGAGTKLRR